MHAAVLVVKHGWLGGSALEKRKKKKGQCKFACGEERIAVHFGFKYVPRTANDANIISSLLTRLVLTNMGFSRLFCSVLCLNLGTNH